MRDSAGKSNRTRDRHQNKTMKWEKRNTDKRERRLEGSTAMTGSPCLYIEWRNCLNKWYFKLLSHKQSIYCWKTECVFLLQCRDGPGKHKVLFGSLTGWGCYCFKIWYANQTPLLHDSLRAQNKLHNYLYLFYTSSFILIYTSQPKHLFTNCENCHFFLFNRFCVACVRN